jgi:hypothetical protein
MVRRTGTHKDMPVDALMAWCRSKPAPQEFFGGTTRVRHRSRSPPGTTLAANKNMGKVRRVTAFSPLTSSTSPRQNSKRSIEVDEPPRAEIPAAAGATPLLSNDTASSLNVGLTATNDGDVEIETQYVEVHETEIVCRPRTPGRESSDESESDSESCSSCSSTSTPVDKRDMTTPIPSNNHMVPLPQTPRGEASKLYRRIVDDNDKLASIPLPVNANDVESNTASAPDVAEPVNAAIPQPTTTFSRPTSGMASAVDTKGAEEASRLARIESEAARLGRYVYRMGCDMTKEQMVENVYRRFRTISDETRRSALAAALEAAHCAATDALLIFDADRRGTSGECPAMSTARRVSSHAAGLVESDAAIGHLPVKESPTTMPKTSL